MTAAPGFKPGDDVALTDSKGATGRVKAFDKVNRVARVYFGTSDGVEHTRDIHEDDLQRV